MVKVRSLLNARSGFCNLIINDEIFCDSVPVFSIGVRCTQDSLDIYSNFTALSTTDPIIWIEEDQSIPGRITMFNDDYSVESDFDWGAEARTRDMFPRTVHAVLLSGASSVEAEGETDLYMRCLDSNVISFFAHLKEADAIQSAPETDAYNCISWTGGIYTAWCWPPHIFSDFCGDDYLFSFDVFYESGRYPGCYAYTRDGATEGNSMIDLWMNEAVDEYGGYTHASISVESDDNLHGYDWESKLGSWMRIFHPRYALRDDYGEVAEHYVVYTKYDEASYATIDEAIAEDSVVMESVEFTEDEEAFIEEEIELIDDAAMSSFDVLYQNWKNVWNSSMYSNPSQIADCEEYRALLALCASDDAFKYAVFDKLGDGDNCAIEIVKDLTLSENKEILDSIKLYNKENPTTDTGVKIFRTIYSNAMSYVKKLLPMPSSNGSKHTRQGDVSTGVTYSNSDSYEFCNEDGVVEIRFSLTKPTRTSLEIIDLKGNVIESMVPTTCLSEGAHTFSTQIGCSGVYLMRLCLNGRINVTKFTVK